MAIKGRCNSKNFQYFPIGKLLTYERTYERWWWKEKRKKKSIAFKASQKNNKGNDYDQQWKNQDDEITLMAK